MTKTLNASTTIRANKRKAKLKAKHRRHAFRRAKAAGKPCRALAGRMRRHSAA